ncbi:RipA family octameric membrane protein [Desulfovibrio inopinatus]|uniref:RipA family octameric membrane protein n=1 Tax=Desulfovibrio inopinatus TaxID=102109 RepID=UPI00040B8B38|nr:hypothetical protein [Desulfovibrio inopinatus]
MPEAEDQIQAQKFELYKLYVSTVEKVSDRRAQANAWMLSVNSALIGLYGFLDKKPVSGEKTSLVWMLAIPIAGVLVCLTWKALLESFHKLNDAKFRLLHEIERDLPLALFKREQDIYRGLGRRHLSGIEARVPYCFIALYGVLALANVV